MFTLFSEYTKKDGGTPVRSMGCYGEGARGSMARCQRDAQGVVENLCQIGIICPVWLLLAHFGSGVTSDLQSVIGYRNGSITCVRDGIVG